MLLHEVQSNSYPVAICGVSFSWAGNILPSLELKDNDSADLPNSPATSAADVLDGRTPSEPGGTAMAMSQVMLLTGWHGGVGFRVFVWVNGDEPYLLNISARKTSKQGLFDAASFVSLQWAWDCAEIELAVSLSFEAKEQSCNRTPSYFLCWARSSSDWPTPLIGPITSLPSWSSISSVPCNCNHHLPTLYNIQKSMYT